LHALLREAGDVLLEIRDDDDRLAGLVHPGDLADAERVLLVSAEPATHATLDVRTDASGSGAYRRLTWTCRREDGRWVCLGRDAEGEAKLRDAQDAARFQAGLLDQVDAAVIATDLDGRVTHWNAGAQRLYGWTAEEMHGMHVASRVVPPEQRDLAALAVDEIKSAGRWDGELTLRRKDGTTFPAHLSDALVHDAAGRATGMVGVSVDVTDSLRATREAATTRDFLTAVTDHMAEGLYTVDHKGRLTYLNPAGERMLGWRAEELEGRHIHDVIHHTHASGKPHPREACPMGKVLRDHVTVRIEDDVFVRRNGSMLPISYSSAPLHTADGVVGSVVVFSDRSERRAEQMRLLREIDELAWVGRVQDALREERFVLHAQPIVELRTRRVVQHELLIRMRHEDELIAPGEFLPTAEKYGLIQHIDRWVIWEAARIAGGDVPVALNLSAETAASADLLETFESAIEAAGANPANIVVEITETALMKGDAARDLVTGLRAMGIRLALDDFGTGYGGFTYLKQLPVHFLKIDREFVRDLRGDKASRHVVEAVVTLARGFGQKTIAEGVEDPETLAILGELGVDFAQGFYLGRPAPVDQVLAGWDAERASR
jgi:PAS domain S-box-containing protein